jgi:GAF domain-containing protein/DNA-binding CsgD family transcriptional regulator
MRTRESVVLDDAAARNLFSDDAYLRRWRPRSVLCMPIIRQAEVVGLLYLENNLTTHVFILDRITVLKLLASQAAISLENAGLYADLRESEPKLRASEQVARGQVEALTYSLDVLATASDPEKFLGKMLSTICRLLTGQSASLWLFDEPMDSLILRLVVDSVSPVGIDPGHPLVQNPRSWRENPVIQELFFAAGPLVCEDVETDPRVNGQFREYFMPTGTRKFLAVPIVVGGQVRGMITVRHGERPPYRTEEIGLMQALAHLSDAGHPADRSRRAEPARRRFGRTESDGPGCPRHARPRLHGRDRAVGDSQVCHCRGGPQRRGLPFKPRRRTGAKGYLLKDVPREALMDCIRRVHAGETSIAGHLVAKLADRVSGETLSQRELEVLKVMAQGKSNKEIGSALFISEGTVKSPGKAIFAKMNVVSRTEAVAEATRRGLIRL